MAFFLYRLDSRRGEREDEVRARQVRLSVLPQFVRASISDGLFFSFSYLFSKRKLLVHSFTVAVIEVFAIGVVLHVTEQNLIHE